MMRRHPIHILFLLWQASFAAQPVPISVSSQVDKSKITIGDLIRYTVTVTHDEKVQVEMPGTGANLGGFEIRNYKVEDPRKQNGQVFSTATYTISTFITGEFVIPPLTVVYQLPGDTTRHFLSTDKIKIVVESVKPSEAGDIKDIKPPLEIPRNWWLLARNVGIGLLIIAMAVSGWIGYRRWKQGKGLIPVRQTPPRPPHEIALEALDRLRNSGFLENGEIKAFYIELSEVIRRYVEGRYFIIAMEMTTTEVLQNLSGASVTEEEMNLFRVFLEQCDLVKFAKYIPSPDENEAALNEAHDIVEKTKVVIEETPVLAEEEQAPATVQGKTEAAVVDETVE